MHVGTFLSITAMGVAAVANYVNPSAIGGTVKNAALNTPNPPQTTSSVVVNKPTTLPKTPTQLNTVAEKTAPLKTKSGAVQSSGMWVWTWGDAEHVTETAVSHNFSDIFLYIHPGFTENPSLYTKIADVITAAHQTDPPLRVWALGGDPSWVDPKNTAGVEWAEEVASAPSGWFAGLHVDVEAHHAPTLVAQPPTTRNPAPYYTRYVSVVKQIRKVGKMNTPVLPVDVSLPWWYHTVNTTTGVPVSDAIIPAVDMVTVITYNDTVAGILHDAQYAAGKAETAGKPYRISAEMNNVQPEWITFYGENWATVVAALAEAKTLLGGKYCSGSAVHDYAGIVALP